MTTRANHFAPRYKVMITVSARHKDFARLTITLAVVKKKNFVTTAMTISQFTFYT